jgi:hypothetical protein
MGSLFFVVVHNIKRNIHYCILFHRSLTHSFTHSLDRSLSDKVMRGEKLYQIHATVASSAVVEAAASE